MNSPKEAGGAITHLKLAHSYLEKYLGVLSGSGSMSTADYGEAMATLGFAAKHLKEARAKDPTAVLTIEDKDGTATYTQDQLAARSLYFEALLLVRRDTEGTASLEQGRVALEKAVAYAPKANYYVKLAETYVRLNRRGDGIAAAKKALELDSSSFDAHKLLDQLEANPNIGVRPKWSPNDNDFLFDLISYVGIGLLFIGVPVWVIAGIAGSPYYALGLVMTVAGGALYFWQKRHMDRNALARMEQSVTGKKRNQL